MAAAKPRSTSAWRGHFIAIIVSLLSGSVGGAIGVVVWSARLDLRVASLENDHIEMHKLIADLDAKGSRNIPVFEARISALETKDRSFTMTADQSARMVAILEQRTKSLEDTVNSRTKLIEDIIAQSRVLTPLQQQVIDSIKADIKRSDERQDRIVSAIDNIYSQLQDHLRASSEKPPANNLMRKP